MRPIDRLTYDVDPYGPAWRGTTPGTTRSRSFTLVGHEHVTEQSSSERCDVDCPRCAASASVTLLREYWSYDHGECGGVEAHYCATLGQCRTCDASDWPESTTYDVDSRAQSASRTMRDTAALPPLPDVDEDDPYMLDGLDSAIFDDDPY